MRSNKWVTLLIVFLALLLIIAILLLFEKRIDHIEKQIKEVIQA